jgi:nucleotide-binding universal stress UspA family protein
MVQAHPLGILLGLIFVSAVGMLFFWMFRVPPHVPLPVVKVHRSVDRVRKVLVPLVEAIPSERAVELACRLGHDQAAELILVHVIVVPYTLSLNAPMPAQDKMAQEALELGCMIAKRHACRARTRIIRHRSAAEGILRLARQEQVDAIVLGVGVKTRIPGEWGRTSSEILHRAECEVIIDKVPISAQPMEQAA